MRLIDLLENIKYRFIKGNIGQVISNISDNSKEVTKGSLYVCIKGYKNDGHQYVKEAINNGAVAIISAKHLEIDEDITVVLCEDTRKALAQVASNFYNHPSKKLTLIGVTGTNGKTSTAYLIRNILLDYGVKVGLISTIENVYGEKHITAERTTENALKLQKLFSAMVKSGIEYAVMEVSSHALELDRVYGCDFNIGIFTNISHDHLDFHENIENYTNAKLKLFKMSDIVIINTDDSKGQYIQNNHQGKIAMTYGCSGDKTLLAKNIDNSIEGTKFDCIIGNEIVPIQIQTPGKFSVYNALAAIGVCYALDFPFDHIKKSLANNSRINGRFQPIISKKGFYIIVDYAHTPDGLENVLSTIKDLKKANVITVFGCGGDRDKTKRPVMGEVASHYSDYVIITSDNPRTEDPELIIEDVVDGLGEGYSNFEKITDRKEGILKALSIARENDIVLIAGKGHEDYQVIGDKSYHFNDIEIINQHI